MISGFGVIYLVIVVLLMWLLKDFVGSVRRIADAMEMMAARSRSGND